MRKIPAIVCWLFLFCVFAQESFANFSPVFKVERIERIEIFLVPKAAPRIDMQVAVINTVIPLTVHHGVLQVNYVNGESRIHLGNIEIDNLALPFSKNGAGTVQTFSFRPVETISADLFLEQLTGMMKSGSDSFIEIAGWCGSSTENMTLRIKHPVLIRLPIESSGMKEIPEGMMLRIKGECLTMDKEVGK
jgi:hypothetical protein